MFELLTAFPHFSPVLNYFAGIASKAKKKKWRVTGVVCAVFFLVMSSFCAHHKEKSSVNDGAEIKENIKQMRQLLSIQLESERARGNVAPVAVGI